MAAFPSWFLYSSWTVVLEERERIIFITHRLKQWTIRDDICFKKIYKDCPNCDNDHQWQASYPCSGCSSGCGLLIAQNGSFSNTSDLSCFSKTANCEWVIAPPGASYITISFRNLSMQAGKGIMRVLQCADIACSLEQQLAELSGSYSTPQVMTSTTGFMKVVFTSDASVISSCLNASWTSVSRPKPSEMPHMVLFQCNKDECQRCHTWYGFSVTHAVRAISDISNDS